MQIFLIIINYLPIPALEGHDVIEPWLPTEMQVRLNKISNQLLLFIFMLLLIVKSLGLFLGSLSTAIAEFIGVPSSAILTGFGSSGKFSRILLIAVIGLLILVRKLTCKLYEVWYEKSR